MLQIIRGDDTVLTVTFTDKNNNPINLTGSTVFFNLKKSLLDKDSKALIATTVSVHSQPTQGITTIPLTETETNIEPDVYYYDLQIKDYNNQIHSTQSSFIEVLADVTRRTLVS